ncbi:hypothetical protein FB451DRAFT_1165849 [Mycena latifolia]|nr:hypothetical protein FB451DRAFT_1165849 [Mycena latifolia]
MYDKLQLTVSILFWFLALIPDNALRYTLLTIVAFLALLYVIHLKRPSTQLSQLEEFVQKTESIIRDAKLHCPRDLANLLEKGVQLLKIKRAASKIQSRMLETNTLTWKKYRLLSRAISDCAKSVKEIRTAVQLIIEAERQRKYTEDINEMEVILTTAGMCSFIDTIFPLRISNLTRPPNRHDKTRNFDKGDPKFSTRTPTAFSRPSSPTPDPIINEMVIFSLVI